MFIKVVNTDPTLAVSMEIRVSGTHMAREARLETLNSAGLSIANDFRSSGSGAHHGEHNQHLPVHCNSSGTLRLGY